MSFVIIHQDITQLAVDAIVNAANPELLRGDGVCGAIFRAAGATKLQAACQKLAPIQTGQAVITPGFNLAAKYIIHAVGPVYQRQDPAQSARLLRLAYTNSLRLAVEYKCASIAFPLISSGVYGYPAALAQHVAAAAIQAFLREHELEVTLVLFDRQT